MPRRAESIGAIQVFARILNANQPWGTGRGSVSWVSLGKLVPGRRMHSQHRRGCTTFSFIWADCGMATIPLAGAFPVERRKVWVHIVTWRLSRPPLISAPEGNPGCENPTMKSRPPFSCPRERYMRQLQLSPWRGSWRELLSLARLLHQCARTLWWVSGYFTKSNHHHAEKGCAPRDSS